MLTPRVNGWKEKRSLNTLSHTRIRMQSTMYEPLDYTSSHCMGFKFHPRTDYESPEGEWRHSSTFSLTSALDAVGG